MAPRRLLRLNYPATCVGCESKLVRGTKAWWDSVARAAICVACDIENPADPFAGVDPELQGIAGGSAQAEHDRRAGDHSHTRSSTKAWQKGADGERCLSRYLREDGSGRFIVLDDRLMPNSRANIDHLAVAPSGVYVIDAKNYTGRVERKVEGFWHWRTESLVVNGRDRTDLVAGMERQIGAVRGTLSSLDVTADVPVLPVLCFVGNDNWGLLSPAFTVADVQVLRRRTLKRLLRRDGPLDGSQRSRLARYLSIQLSPASH